MNSKWLMVVIGWGVVWPIVAIGASYVASRGFDRQPLEVETRPKEPVKQAARAGATGTPRAA